ncbi:hypothetical protein ACNKHV_04895 [Shigella flexneri]
MIEAIDNEIPFTAVCYSLKYLSGAERETPCRAFLCGGEFSASNAIFEAHRFQQTLNSFYPDIAFYSAAGMHVSKGATCFNLEELPVKRWAVDGAKSMCWLSTTVNLARCVPARMGDLKRFDIEVSDCCRKMSM